jgi:hypothetical protein
MKKVQTFCILIDRRPLKRSYVATEENLDDIGHRLENVHQNSLQ